jgi:imidazolonepropionase-like amidohydrolase
VSRIQGWTVAVTAMLLAAVPAVGAGPVGAGRDLLVRDARVFDGQEVLSRTSVLVRDGRVAAVGPGLVAPAGAEVVDGAGGTLLPGLIDAHAHVRGVALRDEVVFGVTSVLDMNTEVDWAATQRAEQRDAARAGQALDRADLFSAGTLATAPGGHGTEHGAVPTVASAAQAAAFVSARIAEGSDFIKIVYDDNLSFGRRIPTLDPATLKALIDAAHAAGKVSVVHIGSVNGARDAIQAGADGLAHLSPEAVLDAEVVMLARQRGTFVIPTLSLNESLCGVRTAWFRSSASMPIARSATVSSCVRRCRSTFHGPSLRWAVSGRRRCQSSPARTPPILGQLTASACTASSNCWSAPVCLRWRPCGPPRPRPPARSDSRTGAASPWG